MRHYRVSHSTARELASLEVNAHEGAVIAEPDHRRIGVFLATAEYELLRAAADLASKPQYLFDVLSESQRTREGSTDGSDMTYEDIFR
jgi:hypothetical protein